MPEDNTASSEGAQRDERLVLVFDESVRALAEQSRALDSVRGRASALLTMIALATSVFGAVGIGRASLGAWGAAALAAAALGVVAAMSVLWPQDFKFAHDIKGMLEVYVDAGRPYSINGMRRWLALENGEHWESNRANLEGPWGIHRRFQFGVIAVGIEVALWLMQMARG